MRMKAPSTALSAAIPRAKAVWVRPHRRPTLHGKGKHYMLLIASVMIAAMFSLDSVSGWRQMSLTEALAFSAAASPHVKAVGVRPARVSQCMHSDSSLALSSTWHKVIFSSRMGWQLSPSANLFGCSRAAALPSFEEIICYHSSSQRCAAGATGWLARLQAGGRTRITSCGSRATRLR